MKIRKTTKIILGFAIICVIFVVVAFNVADSKAIQAAGQAAKAGRSLIKEDTYNGVYFGKWGLYVETVDSLVVSPNGDTTYIERTSSVYSW